MATSRGAGGGRGYEQGGGRGAWLRVGGWEGGVGHYE